MSLCSLSVFKISVCVVAAGLQSPGLSGSFLLLAPRGPGSSGPGSGSKGRNPVETAWTPIPPAGKAASQPRRCAPTGSFACGPEPGWDGQGVLPLCQSEFQLDLLRVPGLMTTQKNGVNRVDVIRLSRPSGCWPSPDPLLCSSRPPSPLVTYQTRIRSWGGGGRRSCPLCSPWKDSPALCSLSMWAQLCLQE